MEGEGGGWMGRAVRDKQTNVPYRMNFSDMRHDESLSTYISDNSRDTVHTVSKATWRLRYVLKQ